MVLLAFYLICTAELHARVAGFFAEAWIRGLWLSFRHNGSILFSHGSRRVAQWSAVLP